MFNFVREEVRLAWVMAQAGADIALIVDSVEQVELLQRIIEERLKEYENN
jgi:hypothetical protein